MARVRELGLGVGLHRRPLSRRLEELLSAGLVDWVGIDVKATLALRGRGRPQRRERAGVRVARHRPGPPRGGPRIALTSTRTVPATEV